MLRALSAAMGWFSLLLGLIFPGNAVSPSPAAPLCWVFCLPPREPVGSAGLCAQGLGRSCRCCVGPKLRGAGGAALGLSGAQPTFPAALGLSRVAVGSAALGLLVGQLASAPGAHPPEVSGVGAQSANLGACNWASGESWGCLSRVHRPGAEGGGAPEAAAAAESSLISRWVPLFSFSFWEIVPIQAPLIQTSTWLLTQPSLALSQESCSRPCAQAGALAALVPVQVLGTLLSLSTLLTVKSFNVLYLWSPIFIYAGIPLAVCSAPQIN